jgi:hypothetical protein
MIENIILPSTLILVGFIYLKWLYKRTDGFFKKGDDLFDKSMTLRGWAGGLLILIVGICFLIRGILKYL